LTLLRTLRPITRDGENMGMRRVVTTFLVILLFLTGSACAQHLPRQPLVLPFAAAHKGTVLTTDFQATEDRIHLFLLLFKEKSVLPQYMGSGGYDPKARKRLDNGLPIPLRLTVSRLDPSEASPLFDKEFFELELQGMSATDYSKMITAIKLSPGNYRVRLEALRDIPELAEASIKFVIGVITH
jgi:hypothetical protein